MSSEPQRKGTLRGTIDANSSTYLGFQAHHDRLINKSMGGLLPERSSLDGISRVLDVGCGSGGWAVDVAAAYPTIQVVGIDWNEQAIEYARTLAWAEGGHSNVSFRTMHLLKEYDFPAGSFDLVNERNMAWKVVTRGSWPTFLKECMRVARPGGIIRLTELEIGLSNSLGVQRLYGSLAQAFHKVGLSFSPDGATFGIAPMLKHLLREAGCVDVGHTVYGIDASYGEEVHEGWVEQLTIVDRLSTPFVVSTGVATQEERDAWYSQAMLEARAEGFRCMLFFVTAWGSTPEPV
jgi:ubiquinone/menaquinone biosynthesis C-methylase UbiE